MTGNHLLGDAQVPFHLSLCAHKESILVIYEGGMVYQSVTYFLQNIVRLVSLNERMNRKVECYKFPIVLVQSRDAQRKV